MVRSPLYAIADLATLDANNLSLQEFTEQLRDAGVRLLQYRDKQGSPQQILQAMSTMDGVLAGSGTNTILNDRADLAALRGWGVHVGQTDLPVADAVRLVRTVGVSTHTLDQVKAAERTEAAYIAIGPVFSTRTKADAERAVGIDFIRTARQLTMKPLVAIGGITLENCRQVFDAGADSIAVISGLFIHGRTVKDVAQDFISRLR